MRLDQPTIEDVSAAVNTIHQQAAHAIEACQAQTWPLAEQQEFADLLISTGVLLRLYAVQQQVRDHDDGIAEGPAS